MVISFKNIAFISSAGLRVLLMLAKRIKSNRGHIVLCEMPKDVREVFEVSGFATIFAIKDSERGALDFLAGH
jgi:anti-anti-sigma factor